jgi:hypothetical protein
MRILGLLKADKDSKPALPQALIERMGTFVEEITKAGVMLGPKDCSRPPKASGSGSPKEK